MEVSMEGLPVDQEASNYDEMFMQQAIIFSETLQDLKNLKSQLYSAAEYFEDSYTNGGEKQLVIDTLKDYAVKALVNTVDHLGSVTMKVNELVDSKVEEVSESELLVSCIEQRLRTCQKYNDQQGLSQQTLLIEIPKYHKRYVLPAGQTSYGAIQIISSPEKRKSLDKGNPLSTKNAIRATLTEPSISKVSKQAPVVNSKQAPASSSANAPKAQQPKIFSLSMTMPKKGSDKRALSPQRFPLLRSGSLYLRPLTPNPIRPTASNASTEKKRYPSEPRKSVSMRLHRDGANQSSKDLDHHPSKSKRIFKSLLSRRKSKKDDSLNTFLDEY